MDALKQRSLSGARIALVPYVAIFVEQYHAHMQDDELRDLTASEPMSLADERDLWTALATDSHNARLILVTLDAPHVMVGDVNVHIDPDDGSTAEVDIMVAARSHRRKGFAREALSLLLPECGNALGIRAWIARIKTYNAVRSHTDDGCKWVPDRLARSHRFHFLRVSGSWRRAARMSLKR